MRRADSDRSRVSFRTLERRRIADRQFLAWVRTATRSQLTASLRSPHLPQWKVVAIQRALARVE